MNNTRKTDRSANPSNHARELLLESHSVEGTIRIGAAVGSLAEPNAVIALAGPLGAGKTQITKGIAEGLGVTDRGSVTSPTFVLEQEYPGRLLVRHLDAYRLGGPEDLWDLGIDEMCRAGGVVVIEWADRAAEALPDDALWIHFAPTGAESRRLHLTSHGPTSAKLLERLRRAVDADAF